MTNEQQLLTEENALLTKELALKNRELEIEAALERVRSRSMAMQKSEELKEVIQVVYDQFVHLNINVEHTGFIMDYKERDDMLIWLADQHAVPFQITIPYFNSPHWNSFNEAKATGKDFFVNTFNFEEKNKFYHELFNLFPVPDEAKEYYFSCPGLAISTVLLDNVGLYIENFSGIPYSDEDNKTLMRFGKVFQQTYTRFNDLKQAEAQSREAQIQLALERVRARTMAMQKSNELANVSELLFKQVSDLGIKTWATGFNVWSDNNNSYEDWITSPRGGIIEPYIVDATEFPAFVELGNARKSGEQFYVQYLDGEMLKQTYQELLKFGDKQQFEILPEDEFQLPTKQYLHIVFGTKASLMFITYEPVPEAHDIFKRFGKTFEQTYTRFLDLQKAEAQSRESQIELSLERVRAKTMAMHNSADVGETAAVMVDELKKLGIETIRCGIGIMHEPGDMEVWTISTDENNKTDIIIGWLDMNMHPLLHGAFESWRNNIENYSYELKDEDLLSYYNAINNYPGYPIHYDITSLPKQIHHNEFHFAEGTLFAFSLQQLTVEQRKIFKRFAGVFGQTYRRYLDLKKAEGQAKESQIQLALQRVRARTMAMHHSNELAETSSILFQQIKELGFETWSCGFCIYTKNDIAELWMGADSGELLPPMMIPYKEERTHHDIYEALLQNKASHHKIWEGKELEEHYAFLKTIPSVNTAIEQLNEAGLSLPGKQCYYVGFFKQGYLLLITKEPNEALEDLSKRFASVFDLTYTRFLDLKKAEAQSRESEIELALERVRARTMAMQHSDELAEASLLLDSQVRALGIPTRGCGFNIYGDNESTEWFSSEMGTMPTYKTPREKLFLRYYEEGQKGKQIHIESFAGDACTAHYEYLMTIPIMGNGLKQLKASGGSFPVQQVDHVIYFKYGYLLFITLEPAPEAHDIFIRFAKVFEQTYTRFLDLQKAEAQAREAQIETALESVRSSSLAMHQSNQLKTVATVMFKKLMELGLSLSGAFIFLFDKKTRDMQLWIATTTLSEPSEINIPFTPEISKNLIFKNLWDIIENGEQIFNRVYSGKEKNDYFQHVGKYNSFPQEVKEFHQNAKSWITSIVGERHAALGFDSWNEQLATTEDFQILKKFSKVFEQAYTRFLDLQKAEAQTKESQIQLALERVRAKTMAMQKSNELADTAAILFNQFKGLGYEPGRITIGIMREKKQTLELWATSGETNEQPYFELPFGEPHVLAKCINAWKEQKKSLVIDLSGQPLKEYTDFWNTITQTAGSDNNINRVVFNFAFFSKGYLGFISFDPVPAQTIELLERFAGVFDLTYTRFLDLKKAEAQAMRAEQDLIEIKSARKKAEDALIELQVTQKQLIQSEKMASLGELTAGIAHEIQNPLNFVNNFSEVNQEMIDELLSEKLKVRSERNEELEIEILNDIKANEEKINHHGKRADAIVKGMLQHSRQTKDIKEPTDINALCDEYLRLSYHGLRAKDKSFNADFKMDFDETIGKINIVPQDIGRVLLNLFNNAFYAVSKPPAPKGEQYKPLVTVSTKKIIPLQGLGAAKNSPSGVGGIEIRVEDNGNGIPSNIKEKIFQPFFTTKPTGQGTGLGLSLAYDIITKQHNGTIKVESKVDEGNPDYFGKSEGLSAEASAQAGTMFIIHLPV